MKTTQNSSAAFRLRRNRRSDVTQADLGEAGGSEDGTQEGKGKVSQKKTCEKRHKAGGDIQHGKRVRIRKLEESRA